MSRIRTIRPEFWTSEQVMCCSPIARLLFIGLWNFSDDHGVHPASVKRIKAEVFPSDSFTFEQVKEWIGELIDNQLVSEYSIEGKSYWMVTGWTKHQRIDKPTYRHPFPPPGLKRVEDGSLSTPRGFDDDSSSALEGVAEGSIADRNVMERSGKENDIGEVKTSPVSIPELNDVGEVFMYWQGIMTHPNAKLDRKRHSAIKGALKLGFTVVDLKRAIDGCANTPHNMGKNDEGKRYDDIGLILRDAAHIERFMANAEAPPFNIASGQAADIMAGVL